MLDQNWYLNGQPRDKTEYLLRDGQRARRDTRYHDNGKLASEGVSRVTDDDQSLPVGVQKRFDASGTLRAESIYDVRGRLTRQREFDAAGQVTQDDQVFEDGSRKAFAK